MTRHCIHDWGQPERVWTHYWEGRFDVQWVCRRCGETRRLSGDKPTPGTFLAASEDFSNALRNLGLAIRDALPGPLRRLLTDPTRTERP